METRIVFRLLTNTEPFRHYPFSLAAHSPFHYCLFHSVSNGEIVGEKSIAMGRQDRVAYSKGASKWGYLK